MNDAFSLIIKEIYETRRDRSVNNIDTRIMKLCEEAGEASGALVSIRENTYKKLTYEDLLEELVDCWIVATDAMLTPLPGQESLSQDDINEKIADIMQKKINKWKSKMTHSG